MAGPRLARSSHLLTGVSAHSSFGKLQLVKTYKIVTKMGRPDCCHVKVAWDRDRSATGDLLLARVQQTATSGERENVTDVRHPSVDSVDSVV